MTAIEGSFVLEDTVRDNLFRLCPNLGQHPPLFLEDEDSFSKIGHVGSNYLAIPPTSRTNVADF
jgi:hypothetical protein